MSKGVIPPEKGDVWKDAYGGRHVFTGKTDKGPRQGQDKFMLETGGFIYSTNMNLLMFVQAGAPAIEQHDHFPPSAGDVWVYTRDAFGRPEGFEVTFTGETYTVSGGDMVYKIEGDPTGFHPVYMVGESARIKFLRSGSKAKAPKKINPHPHTCTRCQSPSFNMTRTVECSNSACPCYVAS